MRAVVVTAHGGPEVLEIRDLPSPELRPHELLVGVSVAGVNFRDIYEREGRGLYPQPPPLVAGIEGAGTVAKRGAAVTEFKVGDRVAWRMALGSYADQVIVAEAEAVPIPDAVSSDVAV